MLIGRIWEFIQSRRERRIRRRRRRFILLLLIAVCLFGGGVLVGVYREKIAAAVQDAVPERFLRFLPSRRGESD